MPGIGVCTRLSEERNLRFGREQLPFRAVHQGRPAQADRNEHGAGSPSDGDGEAGPLRERLGIESRADERPVAPKGLVLAHF